jgi:uncharacterized YccA/Bax inhibitor family protein
MRTANPILRADTFDVRANANSQTMTIMGTVHRTGFRALIVFAFALWSWKMIPVAGSSAGAGNLYGWLIGSAIAGLGLALVTHWQHTAARFTAPLYAACEGVFLGLISALFDRLHPGIAIQAVGLTATTLLALLFAYRSGLVKATENFKLGVTAATGAVCLMYMVSWVLGMFGVSMPFLHSSGIVGIGISMVIVVIAALNLVLDFDFIEQGEAKGAPKHMEWYAAFGLLVTLVWLYLETLRLLSKLQSRD